MKDKSIKLYVNPDCAKFMYYFQLGVLKKKTHKMGEYACLYNQYHPQEKAY